MAPKILIVAATSFEIFDFQKFVNQELNQNLEKDILIDFLITGVGMVHTTYKLTEKLLQNQYDFVLQVGVAGSFRKSISLGEVVLVDSEVFGDMGAEDSKGNMDLFDMNLWEVNAYPFDNKILFANEDNIYNIGNDLRKVAALSVNMTSGIQSTIDYRRKKFAADIESMEGAAFFYVCHQQKVPFKQIRSISNYVVPRDTSQWKMKTAIQNLNDYLIKEFEKL